MFLLFQISLIRAQSTSDSTRTVRDSGSIKTVSTDSLPTRQVIRKPVRITVDSVKVYYTDSIRFSALKPMDYSHLPESWLEILQAQTFFNFTGKAIHVRSERYEPVSYDGMFYLLVVMSFLFRHRQAVFCQIPGKPDYAFFQGFHAAAAIARTGVTIAFSLPFTQQSFYFFRRSVRGFFSPVLSIWKPGTFLDPFPLCGCYSCNSVSF